jgi:hypothetical protein
VARSRVEFLDFRRDQKEEKAVSCLRTLVVARARSARELAFSRRKMSPGDVFTEGSDARRLPLGLGEDRFRGLGKKFKSLKVCRKRAA